MFNSAFYPTPQWLARKMIGPLNLRQLTRAYILDPEAGQGDLLDVIKEEEHYKGQLKLYAVEIEPDLRAILADKGYPVVGFDFLQYVPRIHFTHIIMNPPFNVAEDHLLYAWNMLYEGEIVCLMNATSLEGKNVKEKTILSLIADHGTRENIGKAFAHAERPTDAEIAIVRLSKKVESKIDLDFDAVNDLEEPEFGDGRGQEVALRGFVANLLSHFNAAWANYETYNRTRQDILRYIAPFETYYSEDDSKSISVMELADERQDASERYNTFVQLLQESAWSKILNHPGFQAILTERARNMMREFRTRQKRVDFNEHNITAMFEALMMKRDEIMTGAVLDAFDTMTKFHEENRIYFEGWKSNRAWKVSRKVVLPYYIEWVDYAGRFDLRYQYTDQLTDIDRAMCVVSGRRLDKIQTMAQALEISFKNHPRWAESTFFEMKYYKKGTLHLRFKDDKLWQDFNLAAARGRNWLPPGETHEKDRADSGGVPSHGDRGAYSDGDLFTGSGGGPGPEASGVDRQPDGGTGLLESGGAYVQAGDSFSAGE